MTMPARARAPKTLRSLCLVLASMLLALSPVATHAARAKDASGKPVVVSMGDSYSSGEGTEPFYGQNSSDKYSNEDWLAHRSEQAWPGKLQIGGVTLVDGKDDYWHFVAASAALISHVTTEKEDRPWSQGGRSGTYQLPVQMDVFKTAGLAESVDYVTITIGGNDYGFRDIMTTAATELSLISSGTLQTKIRQAEASLDSTILPALKETYQTILDTTGDQATLVVVGYPRLLAVSPSSILFDQTEAKLINGAVDTFDTKLAALIESMNDSRIVFVDPRSAFSGHEAYTRDNYINEVTLGAEAQDIDQSIAVSAYSLHPNAKGQTAYASVVQAAIDEIEASHTPTPVHTHSYGTPSYEWAAKGNSWACTATMSCTSCTEGTEGHTVSEAASVSYAETKAPTCTSEGTGTYTATFVNSAFATQTKQVTLATTSHNLSKINAVAASCTEAGVKEHWECSTCHKLFSDAQGKTEVSAESLVVPIDANAHSWGEPRWTWEDEHSATATFTCTRNAGHTQSISAEVVSESIVGGTRYTATVIGPDGKTYSDSVTVADEPPAAQGGWIRLAGSGRYQTMAAIVSQGFETSDWAVIATGDNFPDALVASSLAGSKGCPVILTTKGEISAEAEAALRGLGVKHAYVMGGTGAVSQAVEDTLSHGLGIEVIRVKGAGRQATSLAAMDQLSGYSDIVIATGNSFADALSIGPWCYAKGAPILLTDNGQLSTEQLSAISEASPNRVIIVGGTGAVPQAIEDAIAEMGIETSRIKGANRYATSKAIAEFETDSAEGMGYTHAAVATGKNFPDALAGAALCGHANSVLILAADINPEGDGIALALAKAHGTEVVQGYVLGGAGVVSDEILDYLNES